VAFGPAPSGPAIDVPVVLDRQAQEATERQKEILVARGEIAASAEAVEKSPSDDIGEETAYPATEAAKTAAVRYKETQSATRVPANPIVNAAQEYAVAQHDVDAAWRGVETLEIEIEAARDRLEEAIADRDLKKQVLQKLVA
jgi:hypothetical protein